LRILLAEADIAVIRGWGISFSVENAQAVLDRVSRLNSDMLLMADAERAEIRGGCTNSRAAIAQAGFEHVCCMNEARMRMA